METGKIYAEQTFFIKRRPCSENSRRLYLHLVCGAGVRLIGLNSKFGVF